MGERVHCYDMGSLPDHRDSWSVWIIHEATGTLCIFGDYGTWSYTWGRAGRCEEAKRDFRIELLRFGEDYIYRKLTGGKRQVLDQEASTKALRRVVLERRREKRITADEAREAYDDAGSLENDVEIKDWLDKHDGWDLTDELHYEPEHRHWAHHLCTVTWSRVREAMQRELDERSLPMPDFNPKDELLQRLIEAPAVEETDSEVISKAVLCSDIDLILAELAGAKRARERAKAMVDGNRESAEKHVGSERGRQAAHARDVAKYILEAFDGE